MCVCCGHYRIMKASIPIEDFLAERDKQRQQTQKRSTRTPQKPQRRAVAHRYLSSSESPRESEDEEEWQERETQQTQRQRRQKRENEAEATKKTKKTVTFEEQQQQPQQQQQSDNRVDNFPARGFCQMVLDETVKLRMDGVSVATLWPKWTRLSDEQKAEWCAKEEREDAKAVNFALRLLGQKEH